MAVYAIGCCAFRNVRRAESEYPHTMHATMSKIRPRWDYHWYVISHFVPTVVSDCILSSTYLDYRIIDDHIYLFDSKLSYNFVFSPLLYIYICPDFVG